ncbi:MAG TPA: DoxX family protein [Chloroflexota bacterium]|nr:DoxX family protein [Chloroflexota bacterium]
MALRSFQHPVRIEDPPIAQLLFSDTRFALFWLIVRVYAGYEWLMAGLEKFGNPAWTGAKAGTGIAGFVAGSLQKTGGANPAVSGWYASFLQSIVLPNAAIWGWLVTLGELAVGVGLILGLLTGIAAFFGGLMNANYLLAGTVSTNPLLFIFATWLVLAWRVAGYWGVDHWLLPLLGVPGQPGVLFQDRAEGADRRQITS